MGIWDLIYLAFYFLSMLENFHNKKPLKITINIRGEIFNKSETSTLERNLTRQIVSKDLKKNTQHNLRVDSRKLSLHHGVSLGH